jgi:hypothetical protein
MMDDVKEEYAEIIADQIKIIDGTAQTCLTCFWNTAIDQVDLRMTHLKSVGFCFAISRILSGIDITIIRNELSTQLDMFEIQIPEIDTLLTKIIQDAVQHVQKNRQAHMELGAKIIGELRGQIF